MLSARILSRIGRSVTCISSESTPKNDGGVKRGTELNRKHIQARFLHDVLTLPDGYRFQHQLDRFSHIIKRVSNSFSLRETARQRRTARPIPSRYIGMQKHSKRMRMDGGTARSLFYVKARSSTHIPPSRCASLSRDVRDGHAPQTTPILVQAKALQALSTVLLLRYLVASFLQKTQRK